MIAIVDSLRVNLLLVGGAYLAFGPIGAGVMALLLGAMELAREWRDAK